MTPQLWFALVFILTLLAMFLTLWRLCYFCNYERKHGSNTERNRMPCGRHWFKCKGYLR